MHQAKARLSGFGIFLTRRAAGEYAMVFPRYEKALLISIKPH